MTDRHIGQSDSRTPHDGKDHAMDSVARVIMTGPGDRIIREVFSSEMFLDVDC